jgi:predicted Zn finger-like uncharacterized protein
VPSEVEKTSVILSCPSCSAQYFADEKAIGENGRTVRCAACSHAWFVKPELSLEQQFNASDLSREKVERLRKSNLHEDASPHIAYREKEIARRKNSSKLAAITAWSGTAAVFLILGVTAVLNRNSVVNLFPKASSAYAMMGLDVNRYGLEFADIRAERVFDGTTPVLTISGAIVNVSDQPRSVPGVRVELRDDSGRDVESILIEPSVSAIGPGGEVTFNSRLDSPSLDAYDLAVTFVATDGQIRLIDPDSQISHDKFSDSHQPAEEHHDEVLSESHDAPDGEHVPAEAHQDGDGYGSDHNVDTVDPHASDPHGEDHADHG